jgi:hypothetical protein
MPDLDKLEEEYREAQKAYKRGAKGDEDAKQKYKDAKARFALARVEQRQKEEADPDHPRGQAMVSIDTVPDDARELTEGDDE